MQQMPRLLGGCLVLKLVYRFNGTDGTRREESRCGGGVSERWDNAAGVRAAAQGEFSRKCQPFLGQYIENLENSL